MLKWINKYGRLVLLVAVVLVAIVLAPSISKLSVQDIVNFTPASPVLAALVLLAIYCLKAVLLFVPLLALFLAAGVMFTPGWAIAITLLCLACEMSLGYLFGRWMGFEKVEAMIKTRPKAGRFFDLLKRNRSTAVFLSRLIPLPIPLDVVGMFYGATKVPYGQYIILSMLGISAQAVPFVLAGDAINDPLSARFIVPLVLGFGISITVFLVYNALSKRRRPAKEAPASPPGGEDTKE